MTFDVCQEMLYAFFLFKLDLHGHLGLQLKQSASGSSCCVQLCGSIYLQ